MRDRILEIVVGLFLVMGVAALFFLAIKVSGLSAESGRPSYTLYAYFNNAGGLSPRAKVTLAGVVIGRVAEVSLDPKSLRAKVALEIYQEVDQIDAEAVAQILTAGLLGEKYIGIVPGAGEEMLKNGGVVEDTQSSLVLEDLIGKFLSNKASEAPAASSNAATPAAAPAEADPF